MAGIAAKYYGVLSVDEYAAVLRESQIDALLGNVKVRAALEAAAERLRRRRSEFLWLLEWRAEQLPARPPLAECIWLP